MGTTNRKGLFSLMEGEGKGRRGICIIKRGWRDTTFNDHFINLVI